MPMPHQHQHQHAHGNCSHAHHQHYHQMPVYVQQNMPEFKMNFSSQSRRAGYTTQMSHQQEAHGQMARKQFAAKNAYTIDFPEMPSALPLGKLQGHVHDDHSSPATRSTGISSDGNFTSDSDDFDVEGMNFDSPCNHKAHSV